ncbi:hypothetical protein BDL97_02G157500 [Sphagnum fallax]|nr:hypothetical protein BDL97_02G157500 [Sphagnum fallax]
MELHHQQESHNERHRVTPWRDDKKTERLYQCTSKKKKKLYIKKKDTSLKCANFFAAVIWFSTCFGEMEPSCQQCQNTTPGVGDNF